VASIRWSVGAGEDLREVVEYIARDSATYAAAMAGRIVTAVEKLRHHPRLGRMVPEYQDPTIRELIVGNYRVVYRLRGERIGIVAVVHGSQDILRHLTGRPWEF